MTTDSAAQCRISCEAGAAIRRLMAEIARNGDPTDREVLAATAGLPVYKDMGGALALKCDGAVIEYDWETGVAMPADGRCRTLMLDLLGQHIERAPFGRREWDIVKDSVKRTCLLITQARISPSLPGAGGAATPPPARSFAAELQVHALQPEPSQQSRSGHHQLPVQGCWSRVTDYCLRAKRISHTRVDNFERQDRPPPGNTQLQFSTVDLVQETHSQRHKWHLAARLVTHEGRHGEEVSDVHGFVQARQRACGSRASNSLFGSG
jgi:hypothetical protein